MASQTEVRQCFEALRERLREMNEGELAKLREKMANAGEQQKAQWVAEIAEHEAFANFVFMGLFLGESFLIDIKRIADCAEEQLNYTAHGTK